MAGELANGRRGLQHNVERLQNVNTAGRAAGHVCSRAPPSPLGPPAAGCGTPGQPCSGMPVVHFAPARRPRYVSTLFSRSLLRRAGYPPRGWVIRTPPPCHCLAASHSAVPAQETLAPSRALPLSSQPPILGPPRVNTSPERGRGWHCPFRQRTVALRGSRRAGRTVPPRAGSDPAPPPPPPARPAEPARAVSAGGSRPPPSCNGRRRSDAFPSSSPVSKIWVPSLPLLTPRSSAHQGWTSPCR